MIIIKRWIKSNTDVNNNNSDKKDINDEYKSTFKNQQSNQQQIEENIYQDNETQNINHVFRPFHVQNEKLNMIITRMELFVIKIHSQINVYITI